MSEIETIVRPFQLPSNAPPAQPYVTASQPSNPPVFLAFGKSGSGVTFDGSYHIVITKYCEQQVVEKILEGEGTGGEEAVDG